MANAKPVNSKPKEDDVVAAPEVRSDPRRPNPEPETTVNKPKVVTKLDNGTVVEDY